MTSPPWSAPRRASSILELAEGYEELAESLGADVDDPELSADKTRFEEARDAFTELVESKPGLDALAVSPADDLLYVANPEYAPELLDFQRWGLDVINPDKPDPGFPYWENLSWENADKYQPDVILLDSRTFDDSLATVRSSPPGTASGPPRRPGDRVAGVLAAHLRSLRRGAGAS